MTTALLVAAGYVLGSMPWGYWLPRLFKHEDIRQHGSGNIGGTNVWRVYGWKLGAPVVVLDTLKGFAPAFVATLTVSHLAGVLAGGAAMLGIAPIVGGIGAAVWIVTFLLFRYASLASIVSALAVPVIAVLLGEPWPVIAFAAVAAIAVIVLHRGNISRLRAGTENRFRFRRLGREPLA